MPMIKITQGFDQILGHLATHIKQLKSMTLASCLLDLHHAHHPLRPNALW